MKLLFDANLSPKLAGRLQDLFPDSAHVFDVGLAANAPDAVVWEYALIHEFVIVTADADFLDISEFRGSPPKVVRLQNCNYRTSRVDNLLRRNALLIAELEKSERSALVIRNTA